MMARKNHHTLKPEVEITFGEETPQRIKDPKIVPLKVLLQLIPQQM